MESASRPKAGPAGGQDPDPGPLTPGPGAPVRGAASPGVETAEARRPGGLPFETGPHAASGTGPSPRPKGQGVEAAVPGAEAPAAGEGRGTDHGAQTLGLRQAAGGADLDGSEWLPLPDGPLTGHAMRHPAFVAGESLRPEGPPLTPLTDRPLSTGPGLIPAELPMVRRVHDPGWGGELRERVLWLVGRRESLAELRLDPPELGSLEIRIRQEKDTASVHILVQSGTAREALESALPRLRELFGEAGLSLQRLDVAERQAGQSGEGRREGSPGGQGSAMEALPTAGEGPWRPLGQGEGLIDTYA